MPHRRSRLHPTATGGDLAASLTALRRSLELPDAFPPDAQAEAERAAREVPVEPDSAADGAGLADLRDIEFLTIDPAGSTDLDQALHLERTGSGAILHYAIADVPAYVEPGGALDAEARRRGQTMYAPDGRIPLHPPILSEDAASSSTRARAPPRRRSRAASSGRARSGHTSTRSARSTPATAPRASSRCRGSVPRAPTASASAAARA